MFIDRVEIEVSSGNGGKGCVSFRREKFVPKGGPDGGEGGRGGDVVLSARRDMNTLYKYRFKHSFAADNGRPGMGANKTGKSGETLLLEVPCGTLVRDAETGAVIADLVDEGASVTVAEGGRGGKGNKHFASATNQVPRIAQDGEPGVTKKLLLELKLIADVGIIGLPNAGKSTLVSRLSAARPKIADYPFTTLVPCLGVVSVDAESTFVLADIPGLIEGASEGAGLGHEFLRHIERTRILLHLLEVMPPDGSGVYDNYLAIRRELERYSFALMGRREVIALNKCDITGWEEVHRELEAKVGGRVYPISAATGFGLKDLVIGLIKVMNAGE